MSALNEEITWERIWSHWKFISKQSYPELLNPIAFHHITFEHQGNLGIYGYDWIESIKYEERIHMVTKDTHKFLWFGDSLHKGTLRTAENLVQAKGNLELQAAVWLYAVTQDFKHQLPDKWRGDGYRMLRSIEIAIDSVLRENNLEWHFAMRQLMPRDYFTFYIIENLILEDVEQIIELAMIKASLTTAHYKIVLYDSVGKGV